MAQQRDPETGDGRRDGHLGHEGGVDPLMLSGHRTSPQERRPCRDASENRQKNGIADTTEKTPGTMADRGPRN